MARDVVRKWPLIPRDEWREMPTERRLTVLLGRSLDECLDILEEPLEGCNPGMLSTKVQVIRAVLHTCTKLGIEASRAHSERDAVLSAMAADLRARERLE
jgi:hypothetical protein